MFDVFLLFVLLPFSFCLLALVLMVLILAVLTVLEIKPRTLEVLARNFATEVKLQSLVCF